MIMIEQTRNSVAEVRTDRPGRYAKQLVSHLSRRSEGSWDESAGTGEIVFAAAHLDLRSAERALVLELTAPPESLNQMEAVVGRHLVRFGTRDELVVSWQRADGTPGTEQRKTED